MNIIVHYPEKPEDRHELEKRVAQTHADAVLQTIKSLQCPKSQKEELLKAIIRDAR